MSVTKCLGVMHITADGKEKMKKGRPFLWRAHS